MPLALFLFAATETGAAWMVPVTFYFAPFALCAAECLSFAFLLRRLARRTRVWTAVGVVPAAAVFTAIFRARVVVVIMLMLIMVVVMVRMVFVVGMMLVF